jgi:tetratricopeptide (TPR) repeat protein
VAWILLTHPDPARRDVRRAADLVRRQLELDRNHPWGQFNLALCHYGRGEWRAAIEVARPIVPSHDDFRISQNFFLAACHARLGEGDRARASYDLAARVLPEGTPVRRHELANFRLEAAELIGLPEPELVRLRAEARRAQPATSTLPTDEGKPLNFGRTYTFLGSALEAAGDPAAAVAAYREAVRHCTEAFDSARPLVLSVDRYNAACSAVRLATLGLGAGPMSDEERAGFRRQALTWLEADLAPCRQLVVFLPWRLPVWRAMDHWQQDPDLAPVRESAARAVLPEAERKAWERLWAEVTALSRSFR